MSHSQPSVFYNASATASQLPLDKETFKISQLKRSLSDVSSVYLNNLNNLSNPKNLSDAKSPSNFAHNFTSTGIRDSFANFNSGFNIRSTVSKTLKKARMNSISSTKTSSNQITPQPLSFSRIPTERPVTPLLDSIDSPADLTPLSTDQLLTLADELRAYLLYSVGVSGGHFGANLGVVELTIALHYLLDAPNDQLIWDVGHQAYAHKALTGRREQLPTIRSKGGLTAFPERSESVYDAFGVGHSSTAISAGLGMSLAMRYTGTNHKVACVVGDGAMTAGMAFEAMNDAVQNDADLLVVLNDNDMSISTATGGFAKHLSTLWHAGYQIDINEAGEPSIRIRPDMSKHQTRSRHIQSKEQDVPISVDNLFRAIGFNYFGPFDGHDLPELLRVLERAKRLTSPVLVHVYTNKGRGFEPAEVDPVTYHAIGKVAKNTEKVAKVVPTHSIQPKLKYSQVFGQYLCDKAQVDSRLLAITPAMESGSGMTEFAQQFPERFFDVAIAEQHAVTVASGMATQGVKPIVAIYSSFLQRGYDQLVHDVALQNLDVTFAIDRAGLVGEDGATHAGVFDYAFMRCLPNVVIACPKDENECYHLLNTCYEYQGVSAVRYPRGVGTGATIDRNQPLASPLYQIGRAEIESVYQPDINFKADINLKADINVKDSHQTVASKGTDKKLAILAFGTMTATANEVGKRLSQIAPTPQTSQNQISLAQNLSITVVNMRWVKPLDTLMLDSLIAEGVTHIATIEEHAIMGGAGSAVNEYLLEKGHQAKIKNLGIPDRYIAHGSHKQQLVDCELDVDSVFANLKHFIS